jgi:hypothetical protein
MTEYTNFTVGTNWPDLEKPLTPVPGYPPFEQSKVGAPYEVQLSYTNLTYPYRRNAETSFKILTGGPQGSQDYHLYRIQPGATIVTNVYYIPDGNPAPGYPAKTADITVGDSGHPGADGFFFAAFQDNTVADVSVHVSGQNFYLPSNPWSQYLLTNYLAGSMTPKRTNGVGVDPTVYNYVSSRFSTTSLGACIDQSNGYRCILEETDLGVGTYAALQSGWQWHQDAASAQFLWNTSDSGEVDGQPLKSFSVGPNGAGNGNDSPRTGETADIVPDASGVIHAFDSPGPPLPSPSPSNGEVFCYILYAHQWATWGGVRVTSILHWQCFFTWRHTPGQDWHLVQPFGIGPTPPTASGGYNENPILLPGQAQQIYTNQ